MSCFANDSIANRLPFLSTISNDPLHLALASKRNRMVIDLAQPVPTGIDHLRILEGSDQDFAASLDAIRAELSPEGAIEALLVDQVILSASRLRASLRSEEDAETLSSLLGDAEQSLYRALGAFEAHRRTSTTAWGRPAEVSTRIGDTSMLAPLACDDALTMAEETEDQEEIAAEESDAPHWRTRLSFDRKIADDSPVIKGTWVTAGQIVSLIVDGWSWAEILRNYPELSEADIRACLAYTVDQDGPLHL